MTDTVFRIIDTVIALSVGFFAIKALDCLIEFSEVRWKRILLYIGVLLVTTMIMFIGDLDNLPLTMISFTVIMMTCCKGNNLKKIEITIMFASMAFSISALNDNIIWNWFFTLSLPRLLFWSSTYFFIRDFAPKKGYELSDELWKLLIFLSLIPLSVVCSVILLTVKLYSIEDTNIFFISLLIICLVSFVGILWAITVLARQQALEQEQAMARLNQKYYQEVERQNFQVRRLKHDLTNHMKTLATLSEEEKNIYIKQLIENSQITERFKYCQDKTVNAVLTIKEQEARKYNIKTNIKINIDRPLPFNGPDICAIFANALDNAIEASQKVEEKKREITLEAKSEKGMLVVSISNFFDRDPSLKTTKKDTNNHGIGMRSISEVVERNNGNLETTWANNRFKLFLYVPLS